MIDPAGVISYNYRADGQPSSITAPGNIKTTFEYDKYGRQTAINDPSAGKRIYAYDSAGNLAKETDARGKVIDMEFDKFNRLKIKTLDKRTVFYSYNNDGLMTGESNSDGTSTKIVYDRFGRDSILTETINNNKWIEKTLNYANGNISSIKYKSSESANQIFATENLLYSRGYLTEIKLDNTSVWRLDKENSLGMPTQSTTGAITRTYGYTEHGLPTSRIAKTGSTTIQNFGYGFNAQTGNLTWRKDNTRNIQENFGYDNLNRLTSFGTKSVTYDSRGNITDKSDIGNFSYNHTSKPYAITDITQYGAQIPARGQNITYDSNMRPIELFEDGWWTGINYSIDGSRTKLRHYKDNTLQLQRFYLSGGQYEIEWNIDGGNKEKLYIGGDAYSAAAVYIKQDGKWALHYILRDYLGSITHVTNANGTVEQELSYDAWGNLRDPKTHVVYAQGSEPALLLSRGYTGHEHMTMYTLIHMNARLYDPAIGRFLSPDPYVEAPYLSQNFNRYSYALNNPLRYTDLSGEFLGIDDLLAGLIGGTINLVSNILAGNVHSFIHGITYFGIGATGGVLSLYATPIVGAAFISGANNLATQGFTKGFGNIDWGAVGKDSLMGGLIGGASMGISQLLSPIINNLTANIGSPVLRHGLNDGLSGFGVGTGVELINGGDLGESFEAGFKSGAIGFGVGAASGTAKGFKQAHKENISPWSGKFKAEDVFNKPSMLQGRTLEDVQSTMKLTDKWHEGTLNKGRNAGGGWTLRELNSQKSNYTDRYIQYSPGSPRHFGGKPYWKISSGEIGSQRYPAFKIKF